MTQNLHSFNNNHLNQQRPTNSLLSLNNSPLPTQIKNLINITSINMQGNDNLAKITSLSYTINSRSIICCSETKQNSLHPFPKKINNNLLVSSLPDTTSKNESSIIISSDLISHIYQTFNPNQYWCAILLKFKPKVEIILTSLYLPHDKNERNIATKSLSKFLLSHKNKSHILAGDFNTYPIYAPNHKAPTSKQKRKIYKSLTSWIDTAKATDQQKKYTHITKTSMSRIDQIWITPQLAQKILDYNCYHQSAILSDHKAITIILDWFEFNQNISPTNKLYNFKKLSPEKINNFTEDVELRISNLTQPSLNILNKAIKASLDHHIPKIKKIVSQRINLPSFITQEIKIIKSIKIAISKIKNNLTPYLNSSALQRYNISFPNTPLI
jgi:exonuclease III